MCAHPDGVVRFVASLLATFPTEVALHQHQGCARSLTRCDAHGLCAELLPKLIEIDDWATRCWPTAMCRGGCPSPPSTPYGPARSWPSLHGPQRCEAATK